MSGLRLLHLLAGSLSWVSLSVFGSDSYLCPVLKSVHRLVLIGHMVVVIGNIEDILFFSFGTAPGDL